MPRKPRLDIEGAIHHVMVRGLEKRKIFRGDTDRQDLLDRIATLAPATGTQVYAWSLLPNHFHLLVRSGPAGLSTFMRRLQTGYAVNFNRRHRRVGHLFQNRYKSILVEEEPYFLELVRYLHLNPLRAGLVRNLKELDEYRWSGHAALLGRRSVPWQDIEAVLVQFGCRPARARLAYRRFVAEGSTQGRRPELVAGGLLASVGGKEQMVTFRRGRERWAADERVLGSGEFVLQALRSGHPSRSQRLTPERQLDRLQELVTELSRRAEVRVQEVMGGSRRHAVTGVRAAACWLAVTRLGLTAATVARWLGIRRQAVHQAQERGQRWLTEQAIDVERLIKKLT